jgi:hypothetical protein
LIPTPEAIAESLARHLEVYGQGVIDSLEYLKNAQAANNAASEARARESLDYWQTCLSAVQSIIRSASEAT